MSADGSITAWIAAMKDGDDEAAAHLWERYFDRITRVAKSKIKGFNLRDSDEADVALSAFKDFWLGLKNDQLSEFDNRDSLWRLLVVITTRKSIDYIKASSRKKRGGGKVVGESGIPFGQSIQQVVGNTPTPEFQAMSEEWIERLLGRLQSQALIEVAVLKLQGWSNNDIAEAHKCSLRTVERRTNMIRARWLEELENDTI